MNKKPTIVCVDDEETVLSSLESELRLKLGNEFIFEFAESAANALEIVDELLEDKEELALVISDYIMPGMKGDQLLKKIHSLSPNTLKIMLTGQADLNAVVNTVNDAELYRYIEKPWESNDLALTIKSAIQSYVQDRELAFKNQELHTYANALARSNSRLKFLLEATKKVAVAYDKFTVMTHAIEAILQEIPISSPSIVEMAFQEMTEEGERGYALFQIPIQSVTIGTARLKFDLQEIEHAFNKVIPSSMRDLVNINGSTGATLRDRTLHIATWRNQEPLSVVQIHGIDQTQFSTEDREFADTLAQSLSISLENIDVTLGLERKVNQRTQELQNALDIQNQLNNELLASNLKIEEKHNELKWAQTQLVQSEKMAGLGTMVAGAAHELNNPTNFIANGVSLLDINLQKLDSFLNELLEDDDEEGREVIKRQLEPLHDALAVVREGADRIQTIVKGLRTFSRLDEAEYKVVDIVENLQSTLLLVEANYTEHVQFIQDFQVEPKIACWPAELNQAVMNLIDNSCQAIISHQKESGTMDRRQLKLSTYADGDLVGIGIQDEGCGMPTEVMERIFEPFYTTREVGKGTGLGLAVVFGIIEKHQGTINVDSEVGKGTTVSILLPSVTDARQ